MASIGLIGGGIAFLGARHYNWFSKGAGENLEKTFQRDLKLAEQGDARAQYNLGVCYEFSKGVEENLETAVSWYAKSAEQGNARAQYKLGICYDLGVKFEQDTTKAKYWYRKAQQNGFAVPESIKKEFNI